jgi:hypothetical protein
LRARGQRAEAFALIHHAKGQVAAILQITPYVLRHTVGKALRRHGADPWEAAGFMGHLVGSKTTAKYSQYEPDYQGTVVVALDRWFVKIGIAGLKIVTATGTDGYASGTKIVELSRNVPGAIPVLRDTCVTVDISDDS